MVGSTPVYGLPATPGDLLLEVQCGVVVPVQGCAGPTVGSGEGCDYRASAASMIDRNARSA